MIRTATIMLGGREWRCQRHVGMRRGGHPVAHTHEHSIRSRRALVTIRWSDE